MDEAYHIAAGVSYVRTGDYRLNPEHPPLTKLWIGAALFGGSFQLSPFRTIHDKFDERNLTEEVVYQINDPDLVQRRTRAAMLGLNAFLLLAFALAVRRTFGYCMALSALAFLVIDPTVAAHMPVVMTDLPVALLSTTALLLAVVAFRSWRIANLVIASLALGFALGAKHSGLIAMVAVATCGVVMVITDASRKGVTKCARHLGLVAAVLLGAVIVLWGLYGFRFNESPTGRDFFNRPLAAKINDVQSPLVEQSLHLMSRGHLLPRAYLWGLADVVRAGFEGRSFTLYAFGQTYVNQTPFYFFPGVLMVKLPLGLIALSVIGIGLILIRKVSHLWAAPLYGVIGLAILWLIVLAFSNAGYAGIRHALSVIPPLAILGAITIKAAVEKRSPILRGCAAFAAAVALVSALPVVRPWEYYNELVGGAANAFRYFNDEGIDLGQRTADLVRYYNKYLKASTEIPYVEYYLTRAERTRRGIRARSLNVQGSDPSDVVTGTFFIGAQALAPSHLYDQAAFREAEPIERIGNLLVFRGTFNLPWLRARTLYLRAKQALYSEANDAATAERLLTEVVELYPQDYSAAIELGNLLAKRGARNEAIRVYQLAKSYAPSGDEITLLLARQIELIIANPPESVPPVRNPKAE
ncbi:MAG: tetratricopeptide repeat protein [Pyrinomonadaceae bacterium]|nr:tetratricopeptide repeat protein [Pyrinomonadaceae bacterium]